MPAGYLPNTLIVHSNSRNTSQSRAIQHGGHQIVDPGQLAEQFGHFLTSQHDRQLAGLSSRAETRQVTYRLTQEFGFKKNDCIQGERLSPGRNITLNGQEGQEADDVFIVQLARVALAAVQNEVLDLVKICADRPATVALDQHEVLNGLEKRRFRHVPHLIHEMYANRYTRWVA